MPSSLLLRALNPQTEEPLFREAYNWRKSPRRDRVAFDVFAADDPHQIVMGLFNGEEFLAVYVFYQVSADTFDCHFTARRDAPKDAVWAAGRQLVMFFSANNLYLSTHVAARNGPLRRWVESVGLILETAANPKVSNSFCWYRSRCVNGEAAQKEIHKT